MRALKFIVERYELNLFGTWEWMNLLYKAVLLQFEFIESKNIGTEAKEITLRRSAR